MNVKKYLMIVFCVLGVCLAAFGGIWAAMSFVAPFSGPDGDDIPDLPPPSKERANILVMGLDKGEGHTDTLMLFSVDNVNKKVSILSIPRDTRILFQGQYDKINHLYSYKGKEDNTIKAVTQVTGLPIHYYAVVDFSGFRNVVDLLGGVEFEVPAINKNNRGESGMFYTDPVQNLYISLKAGYQTLNGKDAEALVRFRSGYPEADLGRIKMQQEFIKAFIKQKLQLKYFRMADDVYKEATKSIRTNCSLADMLSYLSVVRGMDGENIVSFSLPGSGGMASTRYGNLDCFLYNVSETNALIKQHFTNTPAQ